MTKIIRWGVIGSGGIARRRTIPEGILQAENAKLITVFDSIPEVNASVASEFGVMPASSINELLVSGIDAVYIASPVHKHFEHVQLAAKAGKHILCEKPFGLSVEEAESMGEICNKSNVLLGSAYMMRFNAQHLAALDLIQSGRLGKPVYGRAQLSCWYPPVEGAWRQNPVTSGGGALQDMGSHCLDLLEMFMGTIKSVSCFTNNNVHNYSSEDSSVVSLLFESGAHGTVDSYFCIPDTSSKNILELYGSKGSILAKGTIGQAASGEMIAYLDQGDAEYRADQTRILADGVEINPTPANTYTTEIKEFSQAILEGREPSNSFELGLHNQKVIAACYESAKSGKVVNL